MEKQILTLTYVGEDFWGRDVFKDETWKLFKDIGCGIGAVEIHTVVGDFDGEPNIPISKIDKYKDLEVKIIRQDNKLTETEKFHYQMLSRLIEDCKYYLGHGNRNKKRLWANDEKTQISEIKKIYKGFSKSKKPEWLTWEQILEFEKQMIV